jgi:hypothetical protein
LEYEDLALEWDLTSQKDFCPCGVVSGQLNLGTYPSSGVDIRHICFCFLAENQKERNNQQKVKMAFGMLNSKFMKKQTKS